MALTERVQRKDGSFVNVIGDENEKGAFNDAVKAAKDSNPLNTININRPVEEGHDLVVVHQDGSQELSDQVPEDALNFVPEVDQRFNKGGIGITGGGLAQNSPAAKAAAEAKADEALATRGPSTEGELQEARAEANKKADKRASDK